jgi:hypothetical protein
MIIRRCREKTFSIYKLFYVLIIPIKSGFEKNSKFTTIKSPFLLWGKRFRDWGLEKPIYFEYCKYITKI